MEYTKASIAGNDGIFGGDGDDSLDGGGGSDTLTADNGNGSLDGNLGSDLLLGGRGNDTLTGSAEGDAFVFNTAIGATNRDTITDFSVPDDTIRLDDAIFAGLAADATDGIIYETDTGRRYFDIDGLGGAAGILFAMLQPNLALTNVDFVVF